MERISREIAINDFKQFTVTRRNDDKEVTETRIFIFNSTNTLTICYEGQKYKIDKTMFNEKEYNDALNRLLDKKMFINDFINKYAKQVNVENQYKAAMSDFQWELYDLRDHGYIGERSSSGNCFRFNSFGLNLSVDKNNQLCVLNKTLQPEFTKTMSEKDQHDFIESVKTNDMDKFIIATFLLNEQSTIEDATPNDSYDVYTYNTFDDYMPKNCINYYEDNNIYNSIDSWNCNSFTNYYNN